MKKNLILAVAILMILSFSFSCKSPPPPAAAERPAPPLLPPAPPPRAAETPPDTSAPVLTVTLSPQPFSPDGDGVDDELFVNIKVDTKSDIHSWHIEIREPAPGYQLFSEWSGEGMPSETSFVWDGFSSKGELVQSATDYHFSIIVNNIYNNSATYQGIISVDVLVRREGDVLRVIVPSIVFGSNSGDFKGLNSDILAVNNRILLRIAEVLNRYPTYKIKVEGHANPTTPPGTQARTDEERGTRTVRGLQPLSEERAQSVLEFLATHGVERSRLTAVGMGGTRIVAEFTDRDNWWKNRRVEFILIK